MRIAFLGATGSVTGSKYLVECGTRRVLVDCGLFQGLKQLRLRNRAPLPFAPKDLDSVLLTHAHLDHSGYLPLLVKNGFGGPVHCTAATRDLCAILLPDSGHLQEEEAAFANRQGFSRHRPALPLYTREDAKRCLDRFEPVPWDTEIALGDDLRFRLHAAGHLLGAAMVHLFGGGTDILIFGRSRSSQRPASPAAGRRRQGESSGRRVQVREPAPHGSGSAGPAAGRGHADRAPGGSPGIPSFAVGRAQLMLLLLHRLKSAGRIPDIPVYLDSPMAAQSTEVFARRVDDHRLPRDECDAVCALARVTRSVEESKAIDRMRVPRIILSASGIATGGRVLHHLEDLAPDPRNTVLFDGFQAVGTRGASMIGGAESIKIHGQYVPIRAEVVVLDTLSGHADSREIVAWLGGFRRAPATTFITHGEPVAADSLRLRVAEELGWHCVVPEYCETVVLTPASTPVARGANGAA